MNSNRSKLPPSPRSRHARKPVFNQSILQTNSLDRMKNKEKENAHIKQFSCAHSTSRSTKERKFAFESAEQKENVNMSNVYTNSFTISRNPQKLVCKNHKSRKAMNYIQNRVTEYLCFKCSLYEARRGTKVIPLENKEQSNKYFHIRENELNNYFTKSKQLQRGITICINQQLQEVNKLEKECFDYVEKQKVKFEQKMRRISQQYVQNLETINMLKKEEINRIHSISKILEEKMKILANNKIDIEKNYRDCVKQFNKQQFRGIMDKYWNQIKSTTEILIFEEQKLKKAQPFSQKIKKTFERMEANEKDLKQFTFSKKTVLETPRSNSQFEGIKIISSNYVEGHAQNDSNCYYFKVSPVRAT